jgi:hypothetical protein
MKSLLVLVVLAGSVAGCSSYGDQRVANGAVAGGATGALIGGVATRSVGGAAVGGAVGAVTGAAIADSTRPRRQCYWDDYRQRRVCGYN